MSRSVITLPALALLLSAVVAAAPAPKGNEPAEYFPTKVGTRRDPGRPSVTIPLAVGGGRRLHSFGSAGRASRSHAAPSAGTAGRPVGVSSVGGDRDREM